METWLMHHRAATAMAKTNQNGGQTRGQSSRLSHTLLVGVQTGAAATAGSVTE